MARRFVKLLIALVKVYLFLVLGILFFQRHVMYVPSQGWALAPEAAGAKAVQYNTPDGLTLTSWYAPPAEGKPVIVMFHGNAGNISHRAFKLAHFAQEGYGVLLAEYRGYGGNAGSPSEQGFYTDGRAAVNWLMHEKGVAEKDIVLYGESIGTGTASQMALEYRNARALILEAPFASMEAEGRAVYPWLGPFIYMTLDKYDNIAKAPYINMPVLVVQGDADEVIPYTQGKALFEAMGSKDKEYKLLAGGRHMNLVDFGFLEIADAFVQQTSK